MDIIVGGRLSKAIKKELSDVLSKDILMYNSTETLREILIEYKISAFKSVDTIYIFDTGLLNLTDWSSVSLLLDTLGSKVSFYLITRFEQMLPNKLKNSDKLKVLSYKDVINLNDVSNTILTDKLGEDVDIEVLLGIGQIS